MRFDLRRKGRLARRFEWLELRCVLTSPTSLTVPLDPTLDQFGDQVVTVQAYGDASRTTFGIFDTGASAVTFSPDDQTLFQFLASGIPIKSAGGAQASGIGGDITGDVSEPGQILADGIHAAGLSFDAQGFPVFSISLDGGAAADNVQAMVGTDSGSPSLPTITGTPILNPSQADPNGVAAKIDFQGATLDFSDLIPGLTLSVPDLHFVSPGTSLQGVSGVTTDPVTIPLELFGEDNHTAPGDAITNSPSPMQPDVQLVDQSLSVDQQHFLLDTGSQLTVISTAAAHALGLDQQTPTTTIDVQGVGGTTTVPGYTLDELDLPTSDGGQVAFTNVPVYVLDIAPGIDGLLGTNLWDTASSMLYDPFNPSGSPTLQLTFQTNPDRNAQLSASDISQLGASADLFAGAFGGASVAVHNLPNFAVPASVTLSGVATTISAVEGASFSGAVASFTDSNAAAQASDFTATIDWGDGQQSAGAVATAGDGTFTVSGMHKYAEEAAHLAVDVTITDNANNSVTVHSSAEVADAALTATAVTINAVEGQTFSGTVAAFSDANPAAVAGDFTATIDWGDGQQSAGTVATAGDGTFTVSGMHLYAGEAAQLTVDVAISDTGGSTVTAHSTAEVADAPLTATAMTISAVEGQTFSGAIATFSDANTADVQGDFAATIDWGDGQQSAGTVATAGGGTFTVSGMHAYAESGDKSIVVVMSDVGGAAATVTTSAAVSEAPLDGNGAAITGTQGATIADATVATFTHAGAEPAASFTATIDWGDGVKSSGTITGADGAFSVVGSHVYAESGTFAVQVEVSEEAQAITLTGSAAIAAAPSAHERYVQAVYLDVLGRAPDPAGLAHWVQQLDNGAPISGVAKSIAHSDEYYANFVIRPAYLKYLGRAADDAGVAYWTAKMRTGLTDEKLEADLIASDEFYAQAGGTDLAWIDAVYLQLLGRAADSSGEDYWTAKLAAGDPRSHVAAGFTTSPEREQARINDDFMHYLHRAADPDGLNYWLKQFADGKTNEDLIAGFTGSAEYYQQHTS